MNRRVVHVLDGAGGPRGDGPGAGAIAAMACAAACDATPELEHRVVVLGTAADGAWLRGYGLRAAATVSLPLGDARLARRSLRSALRSLGVGGVVQPWSDRAALACRGAGVGAVAIPTGLLPDGAGPAAAETRAALRERLGVPDDVPLIALLAEPPWHADARRFVYMIGLLDVAGHPVAGLVGRGTAHLTRAERFHTEAAVGWQMVVSEEPAAALVHACDLATILPPEPHRALSACDRAWVRWSVARSHGAGVPVIAGAEWLDGGVCPAEALEHLAAESGSITDVGRQLTRLARHEEERARVSGLVRGHAAHVAPRERFGAALRRHWGLGPGLGAGDEAASPAEAVA